VVKTPLLSQTLHTDRQTDLRGKKMGYEKEETSWQAENISTGIP
jgi:hypothetical protein